MRKNLFFYRRNMLALITILVMFSSGNMLGQGFISTTTLNTFNITASTADKPQSKVWTYGGKWWMVMPTLTGTHIFRLDGETWTSVLTIDPSKTSRADCKVVGDVTHILLNKGINSSLVSVEYVAGTYQLWTSRPTTSSLILDSGIETATVDVDGNGRMWVASDAATDITLRWSDFPYSIWSSPIIIESGVSTDDICVITAFSGKIGVLWSNQTTKRFGFKYHIDGDDPQIWSVNEVPASQSADNVGGGMADDHLNLAVASDGTIYAAVKTSWDIVGYPKIALLIRRPAGTWDNLYPVSNDGTRGIVILNESEGKIKIIYSKDDSNGNIYYKESPTSTIALKPVLTLINGLNGNVTSTKQNYSEDIVIMASSSKLASVLAKDLVVTAVSPPPIQISPNNLSSDVGILPAVLSWNSDISADFNHVQISLVPDFTSTICDIDNITSNSIKVNNPLSKNTTYYWRVNSTNKMGIGDWSTVWSFTTKAPGTSLVAYWNMDESNGTVLNDATNNMNIANTIGNPTFVPGVLGNALQLNGSNQYATAPNSNTVSIKDGITLAAWIKPTVTIPITQNIIKKSITIGSIINGYEIGLTITGKIFFQLNQSTWGKNYRVESTSNYPLNGSAWMHVAATFDGAIMKLYINGVQQGPDVNGPAEGIASNTLDVALGSMPGGKYFFKGLLDDARIYNEALTASEINMLMQTPPNSPTLILPSNSQKNVPEIAVLEWTTCLMADTYRVQVSTVADFTSTVFDQNNLVGTSTTLAPSLQGNTLYYWRVLATNSKGSSLWSSVQSFTTIAPTVPVEDSGAGYALNFSSNTNYIDCGNNPSVRIAGTAITMEAWIKPTVKNTMSIINKSGSGQGYELYCGSAGLVYGRFNNNTASRAISSSVYPLNQWIHVATTYDGVNTKIYINGILEGTTSYQAAIVNSTKALTIANDPSSLTKGFIGSIDEVRLWNTVRTDEEIKSHMTKKLIGNDVGLVGYWRFDEKSGLMMKDQTSNHNDGVITNMNELSSHIWSGAALGDNSSYDYDVTDGYSAVLAHANGDNAMATTTSGTIKGIQIYQSDDNALRTGSTAPAGYTLDSSRFWGVKVVNSTAPAYTMVYNYQGNPLVNNGSTLKLVKRNDISVDAWTDASATLDTIVHTLTVMGTTGAEYALATVEPEIIIITLTPPNPPTLTLPSDQQKYIAQSAALQWSASATADYYRVQVSTVADFSSTVFDQNNVLLTSATVAPSLASNTIYYWRVLATNSEGSSTWSPVQSFTTTGPPVSVEDSGAGYALNFSSNTNYMDCGNNPSVKIVGTAITMEAWIKPTVKNTMSIINKSGSGQGYELYCGSAGFVYGRFNNNTASRAVSSSVYPLNQWIHVATTYDGVNTKIYINGVLEGTTSYQGAITNSAKALTIANDPSSLTKGFIGSIDEVRLWNTVRTDEEIKSNMTKKLLGNEVGLVGYWRFDEKSGLMMKDQTSNHNDGVMTNMNELSSHIWSGAALGDNSSYDYDVTDGYSAVLAHANGDNAMATTTSGTIKGIQIYQSDDNALRTGSTAPAGYTLDSSRFWGVKVVNSTAPAYTMIYNYQGNPLVINGKNLKLVKRNDISVDAWTDASATLDTIGHTLTVMGTTGAEYALATAEPEIITLTPPNPPTLTLPSDQQKYIAQSAALQWSASATADYYRVQVSTVADFSSTVFDQNNVLLTSATVAPSLASNTIYYWRVLATNSEGSSAWSSVQSFTTTGPPVPLEDSGAGYALSFTSSNNYVDCGNNPSVKITGTAITMEAWIKPTVKGTMSILKKTGGTQGYELFCGSAGFVYSRFNNNTASKAVSSTPYPLNQWIHVAATYDGISTKMYINGVLEGSTSYQAPILNSTNILLIANDPSDLTKGFRGSIDEVRLWNTVRTDEEIKSHMTKKLIGNEVGLVGYWRFDEKSGLMMKDETSNHNDGVMTNMNEVSSHIWSSAALGDNSNYDYDLTDGYSAVVAHANGDNATATTTSGTIKGVQIYQSDDNALRTGSTAPAGFTLDSSRFWGVKVINSTAPAYTMVYNYQGNPLVNNGSTLKLVKRNDISVDAWTDASATLDTIGHTLTVMGTTGAEYALATTEIFPIGERKTQNGVQYEESGPELPMENDTFVNPLTDENAILEENVVKDSASNDSENLQGNTEVTATDDLQSKSDLSINNFLAEEATIINIELKDATSVALYDMQGRRIFYRKLNRNMSGNHIELSNVIPGVYIVQVCSSTVNQSKKIVVR